MAYSDSFPAVRPVFQADFANGGRIDPRATYTRSTTGSFYGKNKHLSSENLLLQSSDFATTWSSLGIGTPTGGQTDPSGGSSGFTLVEDTSSATHRVYQLVTSSGKSTLTVYAKQKNGTRYLSLCLNLGGGTPYDWVVATFDLAGSSPVMTTGSDATSYVKSSSQIASGNGYYKCVITVEASAVVANVFLSDSTTPSPANYGHISYTGDGSSSLDIAFASLTSTGATDYNATTTQLHRQYAPTLQTAAINAARFEYSATDGESMGCLIESQFQQHMLRSEELDNASWTVSNGTVQANAGVAPDGTLSADLLVEAAESSPTINSHYVRQTPLASVSASTSYTATIFAKAAGRSHAMIYTNIGGANTYGIFSLSDGSVTTTFGGGSFSSTSCGNGWYRLQMTFTTSNTSNSPVYFYTCENGSTSDYTGNGYGSILLWGANLTQSSHAYSYLKADGAATTKSADSLSVATADIGFTGGPFTIVSETVGGQGNYPMAFSLSNETYDNRVYVYRNSSSADTTTDWGLDAVVGGASAASTIVTSSAAAGKLAISYNTNSVSVCASGGAVITDTSAPLLPAVTELQVGAQFNGTYPLNGHCKRIALYSEALSDSNIQAITS